MGTLRVARMVRRLFLRERGPVGEPQPDVPLLRGSRYFDADFYTATYPDVARSGMDPAEHYLRFGAAEGRNPSAEFDTSFYLASNPDVAAAGINPLVHFIRSGEAEGRPSRSVPRTAPAGDLAKVVANEIIETGCFDVSYYLSQVGDGISEQQALDHYLAAGAAMGLRPARWFDSAFYLQTYKDVETASVNPFHHFLTFGWKELRSPAADIDAVWLLLMNPALCGGETTMPAFLRDHFGEDGIRMRARGAYSHNDKVRLISRIPALLSRDDLDRRTLHAIGRAASSVGAHDLAAVCQRRAVEASPGNARYIEALSESLRRLGIWAEHASLLERLVQLGHDEAKQLHRLGLARRQLGDPFAATEAFRRSLELRRDLETAYQLGLAYEDSGDQEKADYAFSVALRLAKKGLRGQQLGAGVLHEAAGDPERAVEAFKRRVGEVGETPELLERIAHCYERLFEWQRAGDSYRRAARLVDGFGKPAWHYRIGFACERLGLHREAATAYKAAIRLSSAPPSGWFYRLGRMLESCDQSAAAAKAYLMSGPPEWAMTASGTLDVGGAKPSAPEDGLDEIAYLSEFADVSVAAWLAEGESRQREGDWFAAANCYQQAAARDDHQRALAYGKAGHALLQAGDHVNAARILRNTRRLRLPYVAGVAAVEADPRAKLSAVYLEYMEELPLDSRTILYESFSGLSVACNPLAIFRHIVDSPDFIGYTHVWVINDVSRVPVDIVERPNVILVSRDSFAYVRYLATATYLINNSGFPAYFIRRPGQKYLATWHGTPLKTLGKDQKYKFYDHKRTQRNFLHATHIISPNPHTTDVLLDSYEIRSLFLGRLAETGYPRVDLTLNADERTRANLLARLSLREGRKVVLYAPTWRGTPDEVWFDFSRVQADLEELSKLDCQVIFRGHSWLERAINSAKLDCNVVPVDIDTNELLSVVDVLVTDYSSVFFDFYATGRPVVYYIYDHDEYMKDRGLYFDINELPGLKCRTSAELRDTVEVAIHQSALPIADVGRFNLHDDGNATSRVIEFFFRDAKSQYDVALTPTGRTRILMFAGAFADDDRTRLAIEFARSLDMARFELVVAFTPTAVELTARGVELFRQLPDGVIGLPLYGHALMTPEERWLCRKYGAGRLRGVGGEVAAAMAHAFKREFYRFTGGARFDVVLVFDGDSPYWTRLMLDGCGNGITVCVSRTGASPSGCSPHHTVSYSELEEAGTDVLMKLVQPSL